MIPQDQLSNAIRFLSVDAVQAANSGHPGAPMGMANVATVLWTRFLKFDAKNPKWADRDRFVLSSGHASAMLYSLLYLTGFDDATLDDLKHFRQLNSKMAGHPEYGMLAGVEATTGPLGQGISMAVGMALSEKMLQSRFDDDLVNHHTFVFAGDGDLMEGISEEAISFAGHFKLNKLIVFWDNNNITIDGTTELSTSTNIPMRFEANNWRVLETDGYDFDQIEKTIANAMDSDKPVLINCKTVIGYGSPAKAGTPAAHGAPLGEEECCNARKNLNWNHAPFEIPDDILTYWRAVGVRGALAREDWQVRLQKSTKKALFEKTVLMKNLPTDFDEKYDTYKAKLVADKPVVATRKSSQMALEALFDILPNLVGGSADLSASNLTKVKASRDITPSDFSGNNIPYGIREHAMAAIMNGMALHGGFIPFGGTFLSFVDYLKPAMRLSSIMHQRVIYVLTHDSIGVGEDGPTHQPIEQVAMLRAMPNVVVFRPADALEAAESWELALKNDAGPSALILSRQNLPFLRSSTENMTSKGAYVLSPSKGARQATLIATGSEVSLAIDVQKDLWEMGKDVAVVSMPTQELFNRQSDEYQAQVLGTAPRIAIEALAAFGWDKYTGHNGAIVAMHSYGASGPAPQLFEKFGFTKENIIKTVLKTII